jgi:radical SAM superfamily enzyme YgiQ (UPF0313 family)
VKPISALLINPYVYDFSAYSFWSVPLGLLYVASVLRMNGMQVRFIDCLRVVEEKRKDDGRAPFLKEVVERPPQLRDVRKRYRRYGISPSTLTSELARHEPPDLILITSIMTYWYPGAREALAIARDAFPTSRIVVGGIYPSLCYEHALQHMVGADLVVRNSNLGLFYRFLEEAFSCDLSFKPLALDLRCMPYPAHDLCETLSYTPILTSLGCAFKCAYCATPYMHPSPVRREPQSVLDEITHCHAAYGVSRYVLYDDNFLFQKGAYAKPLLRAIASLPFRPTVYNPNALNALFIDEELAHLLREAGFQEIRLGLETVNPALQKTTGGKIDTPAFERALSLLALAGFEKDQIGVYVLAGLPFQRWEDVKDSIDCVLRLGATPHIAEYTPIPHTRLFEQFQRRARYPIAQDPIYQNNALFPFAWEGFTENDLLHLKLYLHQTARRD